MGTKYLGGFPVKLGMRKVGPFYQEVIPIFFF